MVAVGIIGIIAYALSSVIQFIGTTTIKSREQAVAANIAERFFTRLNNIPYIYVFDMDSSSTNYRLNGSFGDVSTQQNPYPYLAMLNEFTILIRSHKIDKFTVNVRFMVRDLGDLNSDGKTTDLRVYTDSNGNNIDDYDTALRYFDQNGDGDYFDIYGSPQVTEQPHTRLKECTFKLYKASNLIYHETQLVSWEKFTGTEGKAAGATLTLIVSTPSENSSIYTLATASHTNSFNIALSSTYPSNIYAFRSDSASPLRIQGETTPNATFTWRLGTTTGTIQDNGCTADYLGIFDCILTNVAANMTEGLNTVFGQAYKTVYYSPWTPTTIIRDISTPTISGMTPTGTIYNLQPTVRATLLDMPNISERTVAGINTNIIRLFRTSSTDLNYSYDSATGYVTWVDTSTNLPPIISSGIYTVILEGGDNAYYKARSTWTFTITMSAGDTDNSEPSVANKDPSGMSPINPPPISVRIFDNQSGIILNSVALSLDGSVLVSSATGNLGTACSSLTQQDGYTVNYTPDSALASGWHSLIITGAHWANNPTNKIWTEDSWTFFIP